MTNFWLVRLSGLGLLGLALLVMGLAPSQAAAIKGPDVSVSVTDVPDPAAPAATLTYTITVRNVGTAGASSVTLSDSFSGSSFSAATASQGTCRLVSPLKLSCALGRIPAGGTATVTLAVTVAAPAGSTLTNRASATARGDVNPADNAATATTVVNGSSTGQADVDVHLVAQPDPVPSGSALTYSLTVHNHGGGAASNTIVADALPSGLTSVSVAPSQGSCTRLSGSVTCALGTVGAGGGATVLITGSAAAAAGTTLTNAATVSTDSAESNGSNNSTSVTTAVGPALADLDIHITDYPDPVASGATLVYTLTVHNHGGTTAQEVALSQNLPGGVAFVWATTGCVHSGGVVTCDLGSVGGGAEAVLSVQVNAVAPPGSTLPGTGVVSSASAESDTSNNSVSVSTSVGGADLDVHITDYPDPVETGGTLSYSVTVHNHGSAPAEGVALTQALPAGASFMSAGPGCTHAAGTVSCLIGSLAPGETFATLVQATVAAVPGSALSTTALVSTTSYDSSITNNTATAATTVAGADLDIHITDWPDPADSGGVLFYALTVHNHGSAAAEGVALTDTLSSGVSFVSAGPGCTHAVGIVNCPLGTLAAGAEVSVLVQVTPVASPGSVLANAAQVSTTSFETSVSNNTATAATTVAGADLDVHLSDSPDPVESGSTLFYTLTVHNHGSSPAAGVLVDHTLPEGLANVLPSASQGSCTVSGTHAACDLGNVGQSDTVTILVSATVTAEPGSTLRSTATVATLSYENSLTNNTIAADTTVAISDIDVHLNDSPDPVAPGGSLTYAITIHNHGSRAAAAVSLTLHLPAGATYSSETLPGTCATAAHGDHIDVTCAGIGTVSAGGSASGNIVVTAPALAGTAQATAVVTTTSSESTTANNSVTESTTVK